MQLASQKINEHQGNASSVLSGAITVVEQMSKCKRAINAVAKIVDSLSLCASCAIHLLVAETIYYARLVGMLVAKSVSVAQEIKRRTI